MDEAAQITALLASETFWQDDLCQTWSMQMGGGLSVEIGRRGTGWAWRYVRPDRSELVSPEAFRSVQAAKNALRAELTGRREALVYERMGPASVLFS
jgi:hypothetical protein